MQNCSGNILKPVRSRELRGGNLYTDCLCLRRNGLQHDCRRDVCQGSPPCVQLPYAQCEAARSACIKHYRNPHAAHLTAVCHPCFSSGANRTSRANGARNGFNGHPRYAVSKQSSKPIVTKCKWDLPCKADCFETTAGHRPKHFY